eukprot:366014-Chlamydomonas_euryale.AAC.6
MAFSGGITHDLARPSSHLQSKYKGSFRVGSGCPKTFLDWPWHGTTAQQGRGAQSSRAWRCRALWFEPPDDMMMQLSIACVCAFPSLRHDVW